MSNRAAQADGGDAILDADVARWSADPGLAPVFAVSGGAMLVFDATVETVLRVSDTARTLRAAITTGDGRVRAGLRLDDQLRSAGPPGAGARIVRIRFDTRGVARPTSCVVARTTTIAGETVMLLAPAEPLPALRAASAVTPPAVATVPATIAEPDGETPVAPFTRLVWRSDGEGMLTQVSGGSPEIAAHLAGRSWHALGASAVVSAPGLFAALDEHRTFRASPLILRLPGMGHEIEIELSGTPSARPAQPFAGFSGFGVVRETRPLTDDAVALQSIEPPSGEAERPVEATDVDARPPVAADEPPGSHTRSAPMDEIVDQSPTMEAVSPGSPLPSAHAEEPTVDRSVGEAGGAEPASFATDAAGDREEDEVPASDVATRGADLSTHEHAAFREIARALGARFAGDDEPPPPESSVGHGRGGAVMAFPASAAQNTSAAINAAIVSALDRLPAGVLVHRGDETLYVNRRFLDLTGYAHRETLQAAGALARLLERLPPHDESLVPETPIAVTTGGGALLAVLVERSKVEWDGGPAELLLVRAAEQADRAREQIARGMLDARNAVRDRDAQDLLEHIEEGVATLDEGGRVLSLNGSARAMFGSDPREIVGGTLADLFAAESESAIAASLGEARERGASEPRDANPRAGHRGGSLRVRIARLPAGNSARFCATLRDTAARASAEPDHVEPGIVGHADFLDRVSCEIRAPLAGILAHAEVVLSEKLGPLGSERYREHVREIHQSGEHVLGVVDDLADLARIEAGRGALTFTDIALNDVIAGCIALMQPQAARDRIVVRTSLAPDLRALVADERSMRQATLNVIANAIRLTEAGGQVIVSTTTAERGEIAFRVRDTGIGMTQEEIAWALEPFGRSEALGGRAGSGLGLTLTKALVEANRGRFRITSRKNEGTLVEMLFPPAHALSA